MNEIHKIAQAVAEHMPEWNYDEEASRLDGILAHYATLAGPDEFGIRLRVIKGRISVGGVWPSAIRDSTLITFNPPNDRRPSITCALDKKPERIARDILCRFVPDYQKVYAEQAEKKRETLDRFAKEKAVLKKLVEASGGTLRGDRVDLCYDGPSFPRGHMEVHGFYDGSPPVVRFDISGVPLDVALQIATELADCKREVKGDGLD